MKFLKEPRVILGVFIFFKSIQAAISYVYGEETPYLSEIRMIEVVVWSVVSFFALKDKKPALWVMGSYLLFNITAVLGGLFLIPSEQYLLRMITIVVGSYFVFGGYVLVQRARKLPLKPNQQNKTVEKYRGTSQ